MIDVLRIGFGKSELLKMTPEERGVFLLLGHVSNQVNVLWKLVIIAANREPTQPIDEKVSAAQTQILIRLAIGALWEGWQVVEKRLLKSKLGAEYVPLLDPQAKEALDRLKKRFGSSRVISAIRNNYAFHHPDSEQMEEAFQRAIKEETAEDDWSIYMTRGLLNSFFFASDLVISHGIANTVGGADINASYSTLLPELGPISNDLSELSFGFVAAVFKKHLGSEITATVVAKLNDAPQINTLQLPFFVETAAIDGALSV